MKNINLAVVVSGLIGLMLGGLVINVVDNNRLKPLFSSADVEHCSAYMTDMENIADRMNVRPILLAQWQVEEMAYIRALNGYENCATIYCNGELVDNINSTGDEMNAEMASLEAWRIANPLPLTPAQQAEEERRVELIHDLAAELEGYLNELEDCQEEPQYPVVHDWTPEGNPCTGTTARPGEATGAQLQSGDRGSSASRIEEEEFCEDEYMDRGRAPY